jgi:hypothetical protein
VELVDTLDLGSSAARCESSSLSVRTISVSKTRYLSGKRFHIENTARAFSQSENPDNVNRNRIAGFADGSYNSCIVTSELQLQLPINVIKRPIG